MADRPERIEALIGKRVRVLSPTDSSRWEGRLTGYVDQPSVIIEQGVLASRVVLPASYEMEELPEREIKFCPTCHQPEARFGIGP